MRPRKRKNAAFIAACLFPSLILLLVFVIYPTVSIFNVSLFKWGGYSKIKTFVGLENYRILFTDRRFFDSLKNSLLLIIVVSAVTLVLSLFCAEVLTRERLRAKTFFRIVLYIPNILSTVVIAAVFSALPGLEPAHSSALPPLCPVKQTIHHIVYTLPDDSPAAGYCTADGTADCAVPG